MIRRWDSTGPTLLGILSYRSRPSSYARPCSYRTPSKKLEWSKCSGWVAFFLLHILVFHVASEVNIRYHNYSLLESGTMLLLDTLLLSILFLYLDQVMPREARRSGGEFGRFTFTDVMELNLHPMVLNEMFRQCVSNAVKTDSKLSNWQEYKCIQMHKRGSRFLCWSTA